MPKWHKEPKEDAPYGTTLLSRDSKENREKWGAEGIGEIPVAASICTDDGQCPYYRYKEDAPTADETPIHLLIASFRDRLCARTLHNALTKAQNPKRLYIRIVDQTDPNSDLEDDVGCWKGYCQKYNPDCQEYEAQVHTAHLDASRAKGPTDARSKLSHMIQWDYIHRHDDYNLDYHPVAVNDFCMQTDSHMDFSDNFDAALIAMFHRCENDRAVLSTYVASMEQNNQDVRVVPNLCMVEFPDSIRNWGTKQCTNLVRPKLTNAMWGAGLSFHRCHAELNVPYDPYLTGVFDGEEGSRGIRFFTHGYDVYTPDRVLVTHDYEGHQHNPVVHTWGKKETNHDVAVPEWNWLQRVLQVKPTVRVFGTKRVNLLLGIGITDPHTLDIETQHEIDLIRSSRYGFGTKRTLEQAVEFTGINLAEQRMVENKCGNLIWVPFDDDTSNTEDYGVSEILSRKLHNEEHVVVKKNMPAISIKNPPAAAAAQKLRAGGGASRISNNFLTTNTTFESAGCLGLLLVVLLVLMQVSRRGKLRLKKGEKHKK